MIVLGDGDISKPNNSNLKRKLAIYTVLLLQEKENSSN
jgi:hypothetical protein